MDIFLIFAVLLAGEHLRARFCMCRGKNEQLADHFRVTIFLGVQERMEHFFSYYFERTTQCEKANSMPAFCYLLQLP